jgi:hypothetical protein
MTVLNGQKTFNFGLKVSADKADEVEAAIRVHAAWMRETHSYDNSKIQLVHYYVAKSDELVNAADPAEGSTGNVVFSINEVYVHPEGIGQHLEQAQVWPDFPTFFQTLTSYGEVMVTNGDVIETL